MGIGVLLHPIDSSIPAHFFADIEYGFFLTVSIFIETSLLISGKPYFSKTCAGFNFG